MPNTRRNTTATFRRRRLAEEINAFGFSTMRLCSTYIKSGISSKVGSSSEKCMRCTLKNVECNLVPFSPAKWRRLQQ